MSESEFDDLPTLISPQVESFDSRVRKCFRDLQNANPAQLAELLLSFRSAKHLMPPMLADHLTSLTPEYIGAALRAVKSKTPAPSANSDHIVYLRYYEPDTNFRSENDGNPHPSRHYRASALRYGPSFYVGQSAEQFSRYKAHETSPSQERRQDRTSQSLAVLGAKLRRYRYIWGGFLILILLCVYVLYPPARVLL